jgi:SRSO17 transposase
VLILLIFRIVSKTKLTGLITDETGTVKKGDMSVGVSWQYCGNVGKLANSQVVAIKPIFRRTFGCLKLKQK